MKNEQYPSPLPESGQLGEGFFIIHCSLFIAHYFVRGNIMRTERWKQGRIVVLVLMIMQLGCGEKASEPEIGDITGTVTDSLTGESLSGVTVSTDPATTSAQTDGQGAFTLSGVPAGEYVVKAHKEGYQDAVSEQKTVLKNEVTQADFPLRPLLPEPPQFP